MNQREAEEIIKPRGFPVMVSERYKAIGYIECMTQVEPLVQALNQIKDREEYSCECVGDPCSCDFSFMQWTAEQALKLWDAAQGKSK